MMQVGKFQSFILRIIVHNPLTTDDSSFNSTSKCYFIWLAERKPICTYWFYLKLPEEALLFD